MNDLISRKGVFIPDITVEMFRNASLESIEDLMASGEMEDILLPSAQPDGIPLEWIDKHLEWLDNCDNDFAQLAKVSIKAMVELWKKDRI